MPPSFVFVIMKSALQCGWDPLFQFPFCMKMAQRMIRLFKHSAPTALFAQWSILYQKSAISGYFNQTNFFDDFVVVSEVGMALFLIETTHFWSKVKHCAISCYGWLRTAMIINISNIMARKLLARLLLLLGWHLVEKTGSCCHICHKTA